MSIVDGMANGLGYAVVLAIIGFFRELLGAGEIFEYEVLSGQWYTPNQLMILAAGAFFALGIVIGIFNAVKAVTFVMIMTTILNYVIYHFVLVPFGLVHLLSANTVSYSPLALDLAQESAGPWRLCC